MLIYEHSRPGRMARAQYVAAEGVSSELANDLGVHARSSTSGCRRCLNWKWSGITPTCLPRTLPLINSFIRLGPAR